MSSITLIQLWSFVELVKIISWYKEQNKGIG